MGRHAATVAGAVLLTAMVVVVMAAQSRPRAGYDAAALTIASASPTPATPRTATPATPISSAPAPASPTWDQATGATAHGTLIAWLVALAVLPFFGLLGIALHARHRARLLEPLNPPLRDREAVHRTYDMKMLEARRGWLPAQFTYSPNLRHEAAEVVEPEPLALPGPVLTALEALNMPGVVYGQRLDTGEPLVEQRVLSLAIGGRPGSGKTSTALLLAAQYVRLGAELRVADPHSGHPESLLTQLAAVLDRSALGWVAETPRETLLLVEQVVEQLERRKGGWRQHNGDQRPVVLVIDEFMESLRLLPPRDRERLLDLVQAIGIGGRKFNVAVVLLAQSWLAQSIGSSGVRNPLRAAVVHAMRASEGYVLTGLRAEAWPADPQELQPGEAYVLGVGASGLVKVRVPLLEPHVRVGELPAANGVQGVQTASRTPETASSWRPRELGNASSDAIGTPSGRRLDAVGDAVDEATLSTVLGLFRGGKGLRASIENATGLRPGGRAYDRLRQAVEEVLRR